MAIYFVDTSEITGEIYAGVLGKDTRTFRNKNVATDEAICAVRDHLVYQMNKGNKDFFGYEWQRKDGKKVVLSVSIR